MHGPILDIYTSRCVVTRYKHLKSNFLLASLGHQYNSIRKPSVFCYVNKEKPKAYFNNNTEMIIYLRYIVCVCPQVITIGSANLSVYYLRDYISRLIFDKIRIDSTTKDVYIIAIRHVSTIDKRLNVDDRRF